MENVIAVLILLTITAGIIWNLIRAKRRGDKCIGCPYVKHCGSKCNSEWSDKFHNKFQ